MKRSVSRAGARVVWGLRSQISNTQERARTPPAPQRFPTTTPLHYCDILTFGDQDPPLCMYCWSDRPAEAREPWATTWPRFPLDYFLRCSQNADTVLTAMHSGLWFPSRLDGRHSACRNHGNFFVCQNAQTPFLAHPRRCRKAVPRACWPRYCPLEEPIRPLRILIVSD